MTSYYMMMSWWRHYKRWRHFWSLRGKDSWMPLVSQGREIHEFLDCTKDENFGEISQIFIKFHDVIILDPKFRSFHVRWSKFWVWFVSFTHLIFAKISKLFYLQFLCKLANCLVQLFFNDFWKFRKVIKTLLTMLQSKGDVIMTSSLRHPPCGCTIFALFLYKSDTHLYLLHSLEFWTVDDIDKNARFEHESGYL